MKKLTAVLLLAAAPAVWAEKTEAELQTELCTALSELAETIMTKRQEGFAMTTVMAAMEGHPVATGMVVMAYEEPRFYTPQMVAAAIEDFRDVAAVSCFREMGG